MRSRNLWCKFGAEHERTAVLVGARAAVRCRDPALPARADVAVIGSGYTGLSAALTLARAGRSVIVFESDTPGIGASSRNGGMLGSALKPSLGTLTRRYGAGPARALLAEAREAYDFLGRFIAEENIDCDYAETGGFTGIVKPAQYDALRARPSTFRAASASRPIWCQVRGAERDRHRCLLRRAGDASARADCILRATMPA